MAATDESPWNPAWPVRHTQVDSRWLIVLLFVLAVIAVVAVVAASMVGQSTAALVIGLMSAAFFAGLIC